MKKLSFYLAVAALLAGCASTEPLELKVTPLGQEPAKVREQILKGSDKARKSYAFDNDHDPSLPAQMWFQQSSEGEVLFIVFYSLFYRVLFA